jgi:hypothetical protein
LLVNLYQKQKAKVKVPGVTSEWFSVKKGVRQGCVLSLYLFNILAEMAMREALEGFEGGINIAGRRITNLRYADDIILLASTEEELQNLVDRLVTVSTKYSLMINEEKTKVMHVNGTTLKVTVNGVTLECVHSFLYLGALITDDAECTADIRARLDKAQGVAISLQKIWKSHSIALNTKIRMWQTLVWPVAIYGCEGWTLKKEDERKIEAFEMKGLRQILRVSWKDKKRMNGYWKRLECNGIYCQKSGRES